MSLENYYRQLSDLDLKAEYRHERRFLPEAGRVDEYIRQGLPIPVHLGDNSASRRATKHRLKLIKKELRRRGLRASEGGWRTWL